MATMTDRPQPHQIQVHTTTHSRGSGGGVKSLLPQHGPSASQILALLTLLPIGGTLLALAGLTLIGTLIGLAVTIPLFILFSPVLVPAALLFGLAVTGFLSSGAFGLSGLSSLSWVYNYFREKAGIPSTIPEQMDYAKRRVQDATIKVGQKTKDVGQTIQNKAAGKEGGDIRESAM